MGKSLEGLLSIAKNLLTNPDKHIREFYARSEGIKERIMHGMKGIIIDAAVNRQHGINMRCKKKIINPEVKDVSKLYQRGKRKLMTLENQNTIVENQNLL